MGLESGTLGPQSWLQSTINVHTYTRTRTHTHTHSHTHTHTHTDPCMHTHTHKHMHTHTDACTHTHTHKHMHTHTDACMHTHTQAHAHTYRCMHAHTRIYISYTKTSRAAAKTNPTRITRIVYLLRKQSCNFTVSQEIAYFGLVHSNVVAEIIGLN